MFIEIETSAVALDQEGLRRLVWRLRAFRPRWS
jgi:hypothetical protein